MKDRCGLENTKERVVHMEEQFSPVYLLKKRYLLFLTSCSKRLGRVLKNKIIRGGIYKYVGMGSGPYAPLGTCVCESCRLTMSCDY